MLIDSYTMKLFKPQLIPAGAEVTQQLNQWLAPVNSALDKLGVGPGAQHPRVETKVDKYPEVYEGMHSLPTMAAKSQIALEMNVDAVFFIVGTHDGFQPIRTSPTPKMVAEAKARREKMLKDPKIVAAIEAHKAEQPEMAKRVKAAHDKLNQQRAKKGIPPKVLPSGLGQQARALELKWKNPYVHLPHPGHQWLDAKTARNYFHELNQTLFKGTGRQAPSMNVVLFLAGDEVYSKEKEAALKDFVRYFNGKLKIIRGLNEITKAASASDSKN